METLLLILAWMGANWSTVITVVVALATAYQFLRDKEYMKALVVAGGLVREAAKLSLDNQAKRDWVVNQLYDRLPVQARVVLTKEVLTQIAEKAYQLLKAELKAEVNVEKAVEKAKELLPSIDPTVPVVVDDLHLRSPYIIESVETDQGK